MLAALAAPCLASLAASCAAREVPDWESFYAKQPRSILVLPVENETTEVEAPRFFLATIAKPLIERGYYVFPVEATSDILASEGFAAGAQLEAVSPRRLGELFGADGLLYVTVHTWDTTYLVFASSVVVTIGYRLVDARSGDSIWESVATAERRSGASGTDPITLAISAAVDAALTAALTDYVPLAREANAAALRSLVPGPYSLEYEGTKERLIREWREYARAKEKRARAAERRGGERRFRCRRASDSRRRGRSGRGS
ncbi:MAG: GNA1162 family protein [Planctomycetota bacterium]